MQSPSNQKNGLEEGQIANILGLTSHIGSLCSIFFFLFFKKLIKNVKIIFSIQATQKLVEGYSLRASGWELQRCRAQSAYFHVQRMVGHWFTCLKSFNSFPVLLRSSISSLTGAKGSFVFWPLLIFLASSKTTLPAPYNLTIFFQFLELFMLFALRHLYVQFFLPGKFSYLPS